VENLTEIYGKLAELVNEIEGLERLPDIVSFKRMSKSVKLTMRIRYVSTFDGIEVRRKETAMKRLIIKLSEQPYVVGANFSRIPSARGPLTLNVEVATFEEDPDDPLALVREPEFEQIFGD